jgi:hypothetical protein
MSSFQNDLLVDWCSHEAAKYAIEHWHYSKRMPKSKLVCLGVWEEGMFIGAIIFGASANNNLGGPYNLKQTEICELVRVALNFHKNPVSKILSQAIKKLKETQPGLRLLVSFADPEYGHNGSIYQATNWIYTGKTCSADEYIINGRRWHGRSLRNSKPLSLTTKEYAKSIDINAKTIRGSSKHRYLYPLDRAMRRRIEKLQRTYPKRESSISGDTQGVQS